MFYGENIQNMVGEIHFIYDAMVSDSEREFSFVVPYKGLAFVWTLFKGFHLFDNSMKQPSV